MCRLKTKTLDQKASPPPVFQPNQHCHFWAFLLLFKMLPLCFLAALRDSFGDFIAIPVHHHVWGIRVHTQLPINSTSGSCSMHCLLMKSSKPCNLYVHDGFTCYLGATSYYKYVETVDDVSLVHFHGKSC